MAKPRMPREHGTNRGYGMHNRDKTLPCEACFRAHAIWASEQRRALKCARGLGWPLLPVLLGKDPSATRGDGMT